MDCSREITPCVLEMCEGFDVLIPLVGGFGVGLGSEGFGVQGWDLGGHLLASVFHPVQFVSCCALFPKARAGVGRLYSMLSRVGDGCGRADYPCHWSLGIFSSPCGSGEVLVCDSGGKSPNNCLREVSRSKKD